MSDRWKSRWSLIWCLPLFAGYIALWWPAQLLDTTPTGFLARAGRLLINIVTAGLLARWMYYKGRADLLDEYAEGTEVIAAPSGGLESASGLRDG